MASIGLRQLRADRIGDLHAVYAGLGSGRLVIAGSVGAGLLPTMPADCQPRACTHRLSQRHPGFRIDTEDTSRTA